MADIPKTTAYPLNGLWNNAVTRAYSIPNGGTSPVLTAITTNIYGMAYAVNDLGYSVIDLPHTCAPSTDLKIHACFTFPSQPTAGRTVRWELYYAVAADDIQYVEVGPVYGEYTIQATDNKYHRTQLITTASLSSTAPWGTMVIFRIRRVASTGTESDVNPILTAITGHFQQGNFGTVTHMGP